MASNCTGSSGKAQARQPDVTDLGKLDPHVDISIVIVNWNTKDLLYGCLSSIFQNAGSARLQVIVVDNGSRDDSVDMVARHFPNVGWCPTSVISVLPWPTIMVYGAHRTLPPPAK
jgi:cellulose synthase/poly-beta-1,6-N-acetylglucosamine synthase-like glycosyltransferase